MPHRRHGGTQTCDGCQGSAGRDRGESSHSLAQRAAVLASHYLSAREPLVIYNGEHPQKKCFRVKNISALALRFTTLENKDIDTLTDRLRVLISIRELAWSQRQTRSQGIDTVVKG